MEIPQDRNGELTAAKAEFQRTLLENDALFSVIMAQLVGPEASTLGADLPKITLEPTLDRTEGSESIIGLRIAKSAEPTDAEVTVSVSLYEYLQLGTMDRDTGIVKVPSELEKLLTQSGFTKSDALGILQAWQAGMTRIGERMGDDAVVDPKTHTVVLKSDLDRTAYAS